MNGVLLLDSGIHQKLFEGTGHVFTTLIITKDANMVVSYVFHPGLIPTEGIEDIRLPGNEIDGRETGVVINESDPVEMSLSTTDGQWP